jgi:hypothetical protein
MAGAGARPSSIPRLPGGKSSPASPPANTRTEYKNISFIHEIADTAVDDITAEILAEAALPEIPMTGADLQASRFDHARDLRKHEA